MTTLKLSFFSLFFTLVAVAETADIRIKGIDAGSDEETTYTIKKGSSSPKPETTYSEHLASTEEHIDGDTDYADRPARAKWQQACNEWKAEIKDRYKNKIVKLHCGKAMKSGDQPPFSYSSEGTYVLRVPEKQFMERNQE